MKVEKNVAFKESYEIIEAMNEAATAEGLIRSSWIRKAIRNELKRQE